MSADRKFLTAVFIELSDLGIDTPYETDTLDAFDYLRQLRADLSLHLRGHVATNHPHAVRDAEGRCSVCGLEWPDEADSLEHECPDGFISDAKAELPSHY